MNPENRERLLYLLLEGMSSSSSSDSDTDEILIAIRLRNRIPRPRITNYVSILQNYSDEEEELPRRVCYQLIVMFENSVHYPNNFSHGGIPQIPADTHILSFLWYACNKACLRDVAGRFGIGEPTLFNQVERVMTFLVEIAPEHIYFPRTPEDKQMISEEFYRLSGFPGVIGCIDGTYIPIKKPAHKIRSTYVNRHDQPSLTMQGICDAKKLFLDVFTGTPSKIHDARVLRLSFISRELPAICNGDFHLLGDSAYPLSEWLVTPYREFGNLTREQQVFNRCLSATRVAIENAFGYLKQRFRQLLLLEFHTVDKMTQFIVSCCVLHNLFIRNNDLDYDFDEFVPNMRPAEVNNPPDGVREAQNRQLGEAKRQRLTLQINT